MCRDDGSLSGRVVYSYDPMTSKASQVIDMLIRRAGESLASCWAIVELISIFKDNVLQFMRGVDRDCPSVLHSAWLCSLLVCKTCGQTQRPRLCVPRFSWTQSGIRRELTSWRVDMAAACLISWYSYGPSHTMLNVKTTGESGLRPLDPTVYRVHYKYPGPRSSCIFCCGLSTKYKTP